MADRTTIYFSLKANAHALLAGAPAASVRRRIAHAALLYDDIVIDDGRWDGRSGPSGTFEVRFPAGSARHDPPGLQTPGERGRARASEFYVAARSSDSAGPAHRLLTSKTTIAWRATFEPIRRELPRAYPWLHFGSFDLYPEDRQIVSRMVTEDQRDGVLGDLIPDEYSRKLVIGSANFALVLGSRMGATVSMDAMHSRALTARMARGQASPVLGGGALAIAFPSAGGLSWEEIDEARALPGLRNLRARLADIEAAAWDAAEAGRMIEVAVMEAYADALHRDVEALRPSFRGAATTMVIGAALSVVTGPLPLAFGMAAGAAQVIVATVAARVRHERSWMAAADQLRNMPRRR
jgi:hypothetical protein